MKNDNSSKDNRSSYRKALEEAGPYLGLGIQLGATMVFFVLGGYFLDERLGTKPWLSLLGAGLGMASLMAQLYQLSTRLNAKDRERSDKKRSQTEDLDEE